MLRAGLVGLPNAGKSTLFNALARRQIARVAPFPFTTVSPSEQVVAFPDERLDRLHALFPEAEKQSAVLLVRDIAGLIRNAHRGEGLGNQFLAHIREMDVLWYVLRAFGGDVPHVERSVDPVRDLAILDTELLLKDLETVEERRWKVAKRAKGDVSLRAELAFLDRLVEHLNGGLPARLMSVDGRERVWLDGLFLLTARPRVLVLNTDVVDFSELPEEVGRWVEALGGQPDRPPVVVLNAEWEWQVAQLSEVEQREWLATMGLARSRLVDLLEVTRGLLRQVTFYTVVGGRVCRAWLVPEGTTYREAAYRIHTDMGEGFVRAEVCRVEDLVVLGSLQACREAGKVYLRGGDERVQDGEVVRIVWSGG